MWPAEAKFQKACENHGFSTLRNGWPDFLVFDNRQLLGAVEVKGRGQTLSPNQRAVSQVLKAVGIHVYISRDGRWPSLKNDAHSKPRAQHCTVAPMKVETLPKTRTCPKCHKAWVPRKPVSVKCPRCWALLAP